MMTNEILKKGENLQSEISDLKYLKYFLAEYIFKIKVKGKKKAKLLAKKGYKEWEIFFPKELQEKILNVVDDYLFDKQKEFYELGKELQNG